MTWERFIFLVLIGAAFFAGTKYNETDDQSQRTLSDSLRTAAADSADVAYSARRRAYISAQESDSLAQLVVSLKALNSPKAIRNEVSNNFQHIDSDSASVIIKAYQRQYRDQH